MKSKYQPKSINSTLKENEESIKNLSKLSSNVSTNFTTTNNNQVITSKPSSESYFKVSDTSSQDSEIINKDNTWRIGIVCKKDAYFVILEILKCLERNGYEWKLVSCSYKIKCRKKNEEQASNNKNLNVLIQVFAVIFSDFN